MVWQAHASRDLASLAEQLEARRLAERHAASQAALAAAELEAMEQQISNLEQAIQVHGSGSRG
jgi:flagellar biosynthesis chaperone FliJ